MRFKHISKCAFLVNCQKFSTKNINQAVEEAKEIVGHSSSFLELKWLLKHKIGNSLHHIKLIEANNPLIQNIRELSSSKKSPSWGLIVLLISKAGGFGTKYVQKERDINGGILHSQKILSEITEMVQTGYIVHRSISNISKEDKYKQDVQFVNKLILLTGDYLLSKSLKKLADLHRYEVYDLVATSLRDLAEANFFESQDGQNRPMPAPPLCRKEEILVPNHFNRDTIIISKVLGNARAEWTLRHLLSDAGLLGKSCQATLILSGHFNELEEYGYILGKNIALALQIQKDMSYFNLGESGPFSLINAPLMFHIQDDLNFYKTLLEHVQKDDIKYDEIISSVLSGNGIQKCIEFKKEFIANGMEALDKFPKSDAKNALGNILHAI